MIYQPLTLSTCQKYAASFKESPETVISIHLLYHGYCKAYADGESIIIQSQFDPAEPTAFGHDPALIWSLLKSVEGWKCINVPSACATDLGEIISHQMNRPVRYYEDIYHAMTQPAHEYPHPDVHLLSFDDIDLLKDAPWNGESGGYKNAEELLTDGIAAGAVISNELVSIALTSARSAQYADIGVSTIESWRKKGLSTAAAYLVAQRIQADGQTPVWSCGEDNWASLRVAEKVGYQEVLRRTYIILV